MKIETIGIEEIKEMEGNPRKMNDFDFDNLKKNIKEFGCVSPLIVNKDNTLIGGHWRLRALKELKYKSVDIVKVDLSKEKAKRLNVSLNRISGEWDFDKLNNFLKDIDNVELTGFTKQELKEINASFDYSSLSEELTNLKDEEMNTILWTAKFRNQEEFNEIKNTLRKVRIKNKIGGFKSEYCNGKVLKTLCEEWNSEVLKSLCDNYERKNSFSRTKLRDKI